MTRAPSSTLPRSAMLPALIALLVAAAPVAAAGRPVGGGAREQATDAQEPAQDFSAAFAASGWDPTPEELDEALDKWLHEFVIYIITDEERRIFEALPSAQMKLAFVERFWDIRDPTPGTALNEYRRDHLERWVTANRRFSAGKPGWATDRGRIYILLGPPNNLQRNPTGRGSMERASEVWTYNMPDNPNLPGVLDLNFVDFHGTGEFELVDDLDSAKIVSAQFGYINTPLDLMALRRHASEVYDEKFLTYRFQDPTVAVGDFLAFQDDLREILRMPELHVARLAELRHGDVATDVAFDSFPIGSAVGFFQGVGDSTAVQITLALEHDQLQGSPYADALHFSVDMYVDLEKDGEVVAEDEKRLNFSLTEEERRQMARTRILQGFQLLVPPGDYDLVVLVRDNAAERLGRHTEPLTVTDLYGGGLQLSSLVLASRIQPVSPDPEAEIREFQLGDTRVVPNVNRTYFTDQMLLLYVQAYGLGIDPATNANRISVSGEVLRDGEPFRSIARQYPHPAPMTRQSLSLGLPLAGYRPGVYEVVLEVVDEIAGMTATARGDFAVLPATPPGQTGR